MFANKLVHKVFFYLFSLKLYLVGILDFVLSIWAYILSLPLFPCNVIKLFAKHSLLYDYI